MEHPTDLAMEISNIKRDEPESVRPLIIAGPCSAESPDQLMATANALKNGGRVDYFRAGIWKPRTSPDSFQGFGAEGLKWLRAVKEETGLKVATEVGCEKHVAEALKYDIDLLWIGARTVSNPFVVQEIAESLRGVDIPVLVKNPLNPDVEMWYGAINRLIKVGIKDVGAIHRGFSIWGKSVYRNPPIWEIPRALKEMIPEIVMVNDPSHIAGKRALIPLISRRAFEEGADGLMIEVHTDPSNALSDSAQQVKPEIFWDIVNSLNIKNINKRASGDSSVDELSSELDMVDDLLIHTLANRLDISRQIASAGNSELSRSVNSGSREQSLKRLLGVASLDGLSPGFIERLFDEIQRESSNNQSSNPGVIDK